MAQEVMKAVVGGLPDFRHNRRPGAFRAWLRGITVNRVREARRRGAGPPGATDDMLERLEDPRSDLARVWDEEHDRHVASILLGLVEAECRPPAWRAFARLVLDGAAAETVAAELHTSVNAVLIAKSRVLHRLRARAAGLIDGPDSHFH